MTQVSDFGTLDDALAHAMELRNELSRLNLPGLDPTQRVLVADARDLTRAVISRVENAIAIDDRLHPEER